jgi:hypothetical protein
MGLSILPPPATMPTIALFAEGITFFAPDGSFTLHVRITGCMLYRFELKAVMRLLRIILAVSNPLEIPYSSSGV